MCGRKKLKILVIPNLSFSKTFKKLVLKRSDSPTVPFHTVLQQLVQLCNKFSCNIYRTKKYTAEN